MTEDEFHRGRSRDMVSNVELERLRAGARAAREVLEARDAVQRALAEERLAAAGGRGMMRDLRARAWAWLGKRMLRSGVWAVGHALKIQALGGLEATEKAKRPEPRYHTPSVEEALYGASGAPAEGSYRNFVAGERET